MSEKPILFSDEMVRAIFDGRKTMTRRVLKHPEYFGCLTGDCPHTTQAGCDADIAARLVPDCPYGKPGDRLWVRETWLPDFPRNGEWPDVEFFGCSPRNYEIVPAIYKIPDHCIFRSTWTGHELCWSPSIHMPRWASRITLEITGVRVERVQDISEADAKAEGAIFHDGHGVGHSGWRHDYRNVYGSARDSFSASWQRTNGKRPGCAWADNPWVWVVEFRRVCQ